MTTDIYPTVNSCEFLCFFAVSPRPRADAFPADPTVCESNAAVEGIRFDPEHHGPLPAGLQG